ncbi:LOW QUALITY PROTEIN: sorcin-like [Phoenix dactylifera]|uniref:LOW QUALITY PROTEIN: sorcin-like n=1 Tax=Phoenix dactylifera TaxID=42345 RepID=A0A8B8ZIQ4_PHODC|nr:LOW QUALITY PROTEIN: sorcin-like [Phoenix dactylifera]
MQKLVDFGQTIEDMKDRHQAELGGVEGRTNKLCQSQLDNISSMLQRFSLLRIPRAPLPRSVVWLLPRWRTLGVLREWFERVDSSHTGNITALQLQRWLFGNLNFPLSIVQQMIRMYDFDRNGTMNFLKVKFLALNKFLLKVQNVFSALERGRGFLTLDDVYEALVKLGFSLDSPAFYTVCESFDKNKMGMVRLDEFISICIFAQSARNLFNSFDTTKRGRVTLDFNQFVYCTANCRI